MIQVSAPANSFTDARFATWLIKHFQIPIKGIEPGVFAVEASSSPPDTQRRLVSYPPNLESAAAPATAFATSSWPRVGMRDGVPANRAGATLMPNNLALKAIIAGQDDAATVQKREEIAEQFTLGLLGQLIRDAMLAEQLARKLAGR
jgi:hypothetical protein